MTHRLQGPVWEYSEKFAYLLAININFYIMTH